MAQPTQTLARFSLFRSLTEASCRRLDAACIWRRASAGEWVLDHQSGGTDMFFVLHGHVRVVIMAGSREMILRDIRDGEFFGELAAIDQRPRSAGIVAMTATIVAQMSASLFRQTVREHPAVCDDLLQVLVAQIRALANRADEHSRLGMRERLYAELLRLARTSSGSDGALVVSPPPTHVELAARVGSHREAITRELGSMARAGLIERKRGAVVILQPETLRRIVSRAGER